jgi:cell division protein FtsQ
MASVTVSLGKGIEMYLEDRDMRLSVATDDWEGNLRRLGVTLGDLAERQELKNVREVRAVSGEVWVVLRQVGQS